MSIPISIQQVIEFGSIEEKLLEVVTSIQKSLSKIDNKKVILAWHPKVENVLRPMKSVDLTKLLSKKIVNDKYIQTLQMGCYVSNIALRFRIGHNQHIASLLENPNLIYLFDIHEAELTKKNTMHRYSYSSLAGRSHSRIGNVESNRTISTIIKEI